MAPSFTAYSPRSGPDVTATGMPPFARAIWIAWLPRPPDPPHTSTMSPACTVCGGQPLSMRYAVAPTSMHAPAAAQLSCGGFGSSWCACTRVNCAKLPQLVSYPQMRALGATMGSPLGCKATGKFAPRRSPALTISPAHPASTNV